MEKAIIYARVSSKDQEVEGFSIPAQLKFLREYASKNNLLIVQEFTDVETAKRAGRTNFNKMLAYAKENGTIKHILVEKTDRLLRNISDYAELDSVIERSSVHIHLVKENTILSRESRSNEKFIFGIKALMAKNYIDNLSEEVKKGMAEKAAQGTYPSIAPYGYINSRLNGKKVIIPDPDAAPYVKKMFELYATGSYSIPKLRKKMITDGMVYRNGKNFYKSKVEHILKNDFYTGVFHWQGKKYENASHEAIISLELYQEVQRRLKRPEKSKSRKDLFPFSNLIKCGICGCSLTAEIKKNKYIYYHCTGHKGNCNQSYLKQEQIEKHLKSILNDLYVDEAMQASIMLGLKESFKEKLNYHNTLVNTIESQIKLLQNRIDQAYIDKLDGKIDEDNWLKYTAKWSQEKQNLTGRLLSLQHADAHYLETAQLILELCKNASELYQKQNAEQKRRLLDLLVSNCTYITDKLDVQLKPVFNLIAENKKDRNWCTLQDYFRTFSSASLTSAIRRFIQA